MLLDQIWRGRQAHKSANDWKVDYVWRRNTKFTPGCSFRLDGTLTKIVRAARARGNRPVPIGMWRNSGKEHGPGHGPFNTVEHPTASGHPVNSETLFSLSILRQHAKCDLFAKSETWAPDPHLRSEGLVAWLTHRYRSGAGSQELSAWGDEAVLTFRSFCGFLLFPYTIALFRLL